MSDSYAQYVLALIPRLAEIPQSCSSVNVESIVEYTSAEVTDALLEVESIEVQSLNIACECSESGGAWLKLAT